MCEKRFSRFCIPHQQTVLVEARTGEIDWTRSTTLYGVEFCMLSNGTFEVNIQLLIVSGVLRVSELRPSLKVCWHLCESYSTFRCTSTSNACYIPTCSFVLIEGLRRHEKHWLSAIWVFSHSFAVCSFFFSPIFSVVPPLWGGVRDLHSVLIPSRVPPSRGPCTPP